MAVGRQLSWRQGDGRLAAAFAEQIVAASGRLSGADRDALQPRQREGGDAVAAVSGAEDRKQRGVLADRHELALAERPAARRKGKSENRDLPDIWLRHDGPRGGCEESLGICAQRDAEIEDEKRLQVLMRLTATGGRHRVPRKRSCISRRRSIGRSLAWSRGGLSADGGRQRIAGGNVDVAGSAHGVDD